MADEGRGDPAVAAAVDEARVVLDEPLDDLLVEIAPAVGAPDVGLVRWPCRPTLPATRLTRGCSSRSTAGSWRSCSLGILFGAIAIGLLAGRALSHHAETLREPFGVVQAALLTLVGLLLAFTLAMAVTRYEARRAAVVDDSNAIGTAYLRAQTLHEPMRSASLRLYPAYADASIALSNSVPGSGDAKRAIARESQIQRQLWSLAGQSLAGSRSTPRRGSTSRAST